MTKFVTIEEAVKLIKDNDTVGVGGFCGFGAPDSMLRGIEKRYNETKSPKNLAIVTPAAAGDLKEDGWGLSALRADGLIDSIYTSIVKLPPAISEAVNDNQIAGYFVPLSIFGHLFRATAAGEPGYLTHVGLNTFVDPREEGCLMNEKARNSGKEIVRLMPIDGKDCLFFPALKIDVALLRGSYADEDGNISCEKEAVHSEVLEMANAVHNRGGIVIFQVEKIVKAGTLDPRLVTVHKRSVDYVVLSNPNEHLQTYDSLDYRPELSGEVKIRTSDVAPMPFNIRKVVARRAAMEIKENSLVNLGLGISDGISLVINEEGHSDKITLTIETGIMGGVPTVGLAMGAGVNPDALYDMADTFDLYDGGGLDQAFLSSAEVDEEGNVNVSKFNGRVIGQGGFIDISQNAKEVCFSGIFTAGKPDITCEDGKLVIRKDGTGIKFVKKVQQVTFSGKYARQHGQKVTYISERCVFEMTKDGLMLTEIAPGVDLEKDILDKMEFRPLISKDLKLMDERIFKDQPMGLVLKSW